MKRIATIQDISCVGRCSLTVALPVISAIGIETAVIPTAVLSTHTAFQGFTFRDLTEDIPGITAHWKKEGFTFDAIYSGYLGSVRQVELVKSLFADFRSPLNNNSEQNQVNTHADASAGAMTKAGSTLLSDAAPFSHTIRFVDPAMADNGSLYAGFTADFVDAMKSLCAEADVVVPNLTELCLLTDTPYREDYDDSAIRAMLRKMAAQKSPSSAGYVLMTGAHHGEDLGVLCYDSKSDTFLEAYNEQLPVRFHGTGDLFASCMAGALTKGFSMQEAMQLAVDFVLECIRCTMKDPDKRWYGVNFEQALPYLISKCAD